MELNFVCALCRSIFCCFFASTPNSFDRLTSFVSWRSHQTWIVYSVDSHIAHANLKSGSHEAITNYKKRITLMVTTMWNRFMSSLWNRIEVIVEAHNRQANVSRQRSFTLCGHFIVFFSFFNALETICFSACGHNMNIKSNDESIFVLLDLISIFESISLLDLFLALLSTFPYIALFCYNWNDLCESIRSRFGAIERENNGKNS